MQRLAKRFLVSLGVVFLLFQSASSSWPFPADESGSTFVFQGVNVITMNSDQVLRGAMVIVAGGRITYVGDESAAAVPRGAVQIPSTGKYLVPGFVDAYAHVNERNLVLFIANGVTTVRNAPGELFQQGLKQQVDSGRIIGPRIYSVAPPIGGLPPTYHSQGIIARSDDARFAVKESKRIGYNAAFIYNNIAPVPYQAVMEEAGAVHLPVEGHLPFLVPSSTYFGGVQRSFENLVSIVDQETGRLYFPDEYIPGFVAQCRRARKYVIPTLNMHKVRAASSQIAALAQAREMQYVPPRQRAAWRLSAPSYRYTGAPQIVKAMHEGGVQLLVGSESGYPFIVPGFSYLSELKNLAETGMSRYELLKAATKDAAEYLNWQDQIGAVAVGKSADLVLLDANPLDDIGNVAKRAGVMVRGQWYSAERLDALLAELAAEFKSYETKDRFASFPTPDAGQYTQVGQYEIRVRGVLAGEERLFAARDNSGFHLLSQCSIDPHNSRKLTTTYAVASDGSARLDLQEEGGEGVTRLRVDKEGTVTKIHGEIPFYGRVNLRERTELGALLLGPPTSTNIDMDILANYQMLLRAVSSLQPGQSAILTSKKLKLNTDEWGRDSVVGDVEYLVKRLGDDAVGTPARTGETRTYLVKHPGYNGGNALSGQYFSSLIVVDETGYIVSLDFSSDMVFIPTAAAVRVVRVTR